jgi:RNA polymerase sigma factor (sigma-70 family)
MDIISHLTLLEPQFQRMCCESGIDSADLRQEVWLRCQRAYPSHDWENPDARKLLTAIARNFMRDRWKNRHRENSAFKKAAIHDGQDGDFREFENHEYLAVRISRLPAIYQQCLQAVLFTGETSKAAATRLGIRPSTFRTRIKRAYEFLRAMEV